MDNSVIMCDEIIDTVETKTATTNFNEKNSFCKTKKFNILLAFLLVTNPLLMVAIFTVI